MSDKPRIRSEGVPVSMTRHLVLEDDMKEYWGFYLLRGSSVTVSTCVRWPGASLTMIRGHKHLHECAFIGDDSSEELEELVEVAEEQGLIKLNLTSKEGPSNQPDKMKRVNQGVEFHDGIQNQENVTSERSSYHYSSHELDAKAMRTILTQLFQKTLGTKQKQRENPHHRYEGVFMEDANIDKPPDISSVKNQAKVKGYLSTTTPSVTQMDSTKVKVTTGRTTKEDGFEGGTSSPKLKSLKEDLQQKDNATSAEVFQGVLRKIGSLGQKGRLMLQRLMKEIDEQDAENDMLRKMVNETMNNQKLSEIEKKRIRRDLVLSSPLGQELTDEDGDGNAAEEEDIQLNPDGIAEDRGSVNETTLNDRSNSEFWSSFSSSEERLLECNGLILNLPLTPHRECTPKLENHHAAASFANTVTYRVPVDGYYFFVFNSENEIQPNFVRVQFDLLKTVYNTSNPVKECKNSTYECSLPFSIFSNERTILELPLTGNDSQWNEEYVVVSTCEPRTSIYLLCIIMVPLLIIIFAFH
ncbi:uncharacterized protein [Prorops nasuta]